MKTKCVIFDFDGTLTHRTNDTNSWHNIWEAMGDIETDDKIYNMWLRGELSTDEWRRFVIDRFRELGVNKKVINKIASEMVLLKNVGEVLSTLHDSGIKIYIHSGGVKTIITEVLKNYLPIIDGIEADDLLFDENGYVSGRLPSECNNLNKTEYVLKLLLDYGFDPKEVLFVGNGVNDEPVALAGVNMLCLNPSSKTNYQNDKIWNNYIRTDDISDILKFIDFGSSEFQKD